MTDMTAVIVPKSDQVNADDLISGPRTIRIAGVKVSPGSEQPVSIAIEGDSKVYRPCKSMARVMVAAWGADSSAYVGRSMTLYRDPKVKWGGMEVGGIRIAAMSDIEGPMTMALTETRAQRRPFTVRPLAASAPATARKGPSPDEWAGAYQERVAACATLDELLALQQERAKGLSTLAEKRPDLHRACIEAGTKRAAELRGPDDEDDAEPIGEDQDDIFADAAD